MEESRNQGIPVDVDSDGDIGGLNVNSILEQTVGVEFDSEEEVKSFYKMYACRKCFQWKIRNSKTELGGQQRYLILACT